MTGGGTTPGTRARYAACRWAAAGAAWGCCSLARSASRPVGTSSAWCRRGRGMGRVSEPAFAASHEAAMVAKEVTARVQTDLFCGMGFDFIFYNPHTKKAIVTYLYYTLYRII